jgi:hypothetical protein
MRHTDQIENEKMGVHCNVGALTSRNPMGLHGLEQGYLYFTLQGSLVSLNN